MPNLKKTYSTILFVFWSVFLVARDLPTPTRRDATTPCLPGENCDGVPIDDYLPLLFFIGIAMAVWVYNSHAVKQVSDSE